MIRTPPAVNTSSKAEENLPSRSRMKNLKPVGAEYSAALCDLGVFMDQPTESISSDDLDVGVDRVG
jgi:hypothetical protein